MMHDKRRVSAQAKVQAKDHGLDTKITSVSLPTAIVKQGDHASASFKQCILAAVENAEIDAAPRLLLQTIDRYTGVDGSQKCFEAHINMSD